MLCYVFLSNNSFKKIYNYEDVDWLVVGNSHVYKLLLHTDNVYYLNEDGADIERRMKQIKVGLSDFHNVKYFIINISPIELYKPLDVKAEDNNFLYVNSPLDFVDFFESKIVRSPFSILDNKSRSDYFLPNGRKISLGIHSSKPVDLLRDSHFQGVKPNLNYYMRSKNELLKIVSFLKNKKYRVVVISMPLHPAYIHRIEKYINKYDVPNLAIFREDMKSLGADCYIELYKYPLPTDMFWNGDHLNESGSVSMSSVINEKIMDCIAFNK